MVVGTVKGRGAKGSRPDHYPSFERLSWYSRGIRLYRRYSTRRSGVSREWYERERSFETTPPPPPDPIISARYVRDSSSFHSPPPILIPFPSTPSSMDLPLKYFICVCTRFVKIPFVAKWLNRINEENEGNFQGEFNNVVWRCGWRNSRNLKNI